MNYPAKHGITPELLRECLAYSPATGRFFYKHRDRKHFPDNRSHAVFHARFAGRECFKILSGTGYLHGSINGVVINSHIAAWAIVHGEWPKGQIDHINGDRLDNRIENLRDVPAILNNCNRAKSKGKSSKYLGVSFKKGRNKWRAHIQVDGKYIHLGHFGTEEDAVAARLKAQRQYSQFHDNHGQRFVIGS